MSKFYIGEKVLIKPYDKILEIARFDFLLYGFLFVSKNEVTHPVFSSRSLEFPIVYVNAFEIKTDKEFCGKCFKIVYKQFVDDMWYYFFENAPKGQYFPEWCLESNKKTMEIE